jgi:hypothetical protein
VSLPDALTHEEGELSAPSVQDWCELAIPKCSRLAILLSTYVALRGTSREAVLIFYVKVGGVYDPQTHRYDHHQRGFTETYSPEHATKLSSAGLIYKYVLVLFFFYYMNGSRSFVGTLPLESSLGTSGVQNLILRSRSSFASSTTILSKVWTALIMVSINTRLWVAARSVKSTRTVQT